MWIFGVYLITGIVFTGVGLVVWWLKPRTDESWAMLGLGCCVGAFAITATDLYGPHWFYRLHLTAEAFLPATLVHLAMVFPTPTSPKIETWGDRIVLPEGHSCGAVRFAFPAPGTALRMGAATDHRQRSQPSHRERRKDSPK